MSAHALRDDPKLIGYFYCDCPQWVHTSPATKWRGSLVDPDLLASDAGRRELSAIAERYYQVTHDSIRRYDPNHLILGDRWEANRSATRGKWSVRHCPTSMYSVFMFWDSREHSHEDAALGRLCRPTGSASRRSGAYMRPRRHQLAADSGPLARYRPLSPSDGRAVDIPQCVGYHLCGAYLKNNARKYGLRDRANNQINETVAGIRAVNTEMQRRQNP